MKKLILTVALAGITGFGSFTAIAQTAAKTKMAKTTGIEKKEGVMVGGAMMVPSKNIVENAVGSSEHTTLVAAVKAAGLAETLMGSGPFTVFAPTNAAFEKLPAGTVETLLKPENKAKLASVLTYHVVPGRLQAKDLKNGQKLTTVNGAALTVTRQGNMVMINGANVTTADVISSNGVTHVLDGVVLPPQ
ncbi:fasciclin [Adhaeribacter aerolatus]|uniref:Fasciclin n=1 Tax=Adhaeribacter aerolatus TaxID=670289 RepID=A0A512AZB8_9BACT|nr:fasciclin [Adhaeribacter aerolatus]